MCFGVLCALLHPPVVFCLLILRGPPPASEFEAASRTASMAALPHVITLRLLLGEREVETSSARGAGGRPECRAGQYVGTVLTTHTSDVPTVSPGGIADPWVRTADRGGSPAKRCASPHGWRLGDSFGVASEADGPLIVVSLSNRTDALEGLEPPPPPKALCVGGVPQAEAAARYRQQERQAVREVLEDPSFRHRRLSAVQPS